MKNLEDPRWMYLKAFLFLVIGGFSAALLILELRQPWLIALLCLTIWSFCRIYYFLFYVIEKYIDPDFKFSGVFWALVYFLRRKAVRK
jgi:hypothetical protein